MKETIKLAYHLPETIISNDDLAQEFPTITAETIFKQTGIKRRQVVKPYELGSDISYKAAHRLITKENINRKSIDLLISCNQGPDFKAPSNSVLLHHRLGLKKECACFDLPVGCSGYVYALSMAKALLTSGQAHTALILTSEVPSHIIHPSDLYLRMIFGDAATATFLTNSFSSKIGKFVFGADGEGADALYVDRSSSRNPIDIEWLTQYKDIPGQMQHGRLHMNGSAIVNFSIKLVPQLLNDTLEKNNLKFEEIDLFIFHQASGFILNVLRKKCKIPEEKFVVCIENFGNTVSNTIPIALAESIAQGRAKKGMKIMLLGFGIGFTWAGTIIEL
jgi:3-oxoacyl-[acyl-carrier-protein] synthase III